MKAFFLLILLGFPLTRTYALTSREAELHYDSFSEGLRDGDVRLELINGRTLSIHHRKIIVDSLWDFTINPENADKLESARKVWKGLDFNSMPLPEKVRLYLLGIALNESSHRLTNLQVDLEKRLTGKLDNRTLIILFNHAEMLRNHGLGRNLDEVEVANLKLKYEYDLIVESGTDQLWGEDLREIFRLKPEVKKSLVYLACRSNRSYPCLMLVKDRTGAFVRNRGGALFALPSLTMSRYEIPFNFENGDTPTGLFLIESVMQVADKPLDYGANRRLILKIASQAQAQKLLPKRQRNRAWWRQLLLAVELGRENLRIHGTGRMNTDTDSLHPNLVPSLGCIKLREGKYGDTTYNDQRLLLDTLMNAQGLKKVKSNEPAIRAHLLLFNIPGEGPVLLEDLHDFFD